MRITSGGGPGADAFGAPWCLRRQRQLRSIKGGLACPLLNDHDPRVTPDQRVCKTGPTGRALQA